MLISSRIKYKGNHSSYIMMWDGSVEGIYIKRYQQSILRDPKTFKDLYKMLVSLKAFGIFRTGNCKKKNRGRLRAAQAPPPPPLQITIGRPGGGGLIPLWIFGRI